MGALMISGVKLQHVDQFAAICLCTSPYFSYELEWTRERELNLGAIFCLMRFIRVHNHTLVYEYIGYRVMKKVQ